MAAGRKPLLTKKSVAAQCRFAELHLNKPPDVCNNVLWILSHVYAFTASKFRPVVFNPLYNIPILLFTYCPYFLWSSSAAYLSVYLYTLHSTDHQKYAIHSHLQKKKVLTFSLCLLPLIFLVQPLFTRL